MGGPPDAPERYRKTSPLLSTASCLTSPAPAVGGSRFLSSLLSSHRHRSAKAAATSSPGRSRRCTWARSLFGTICRRGRDRRCGVGSNRRISVAPLRADVVAKTLRIHSFSGDVCRTNTPCYQTSAGAGLTMWTLSSRGPPFSSSRYRGSTIGPAAVRLRPSLTAGDPAS